MRHKVLEVGNQVSEVLGLHGRSLVDVKDLEVGGLENLSMRVLDHLVLHYLHGLRLRGHLLWRRHLLRRRHLLHRVRLRGHVL